MNTSAATMMEHTLRNTPLFADLSSEALSRLAAGCRLRRLSKGSTLFREGERAEGFYVVHSGAVNVHRVTEDGYEQVIRVFYPRESFGEVVLVGDGSYPASAKALGECMIILIPTTFFREAIQEDPDLALCILASMSQHLRYLVEANENLKLRQAESRVAQWILQQLNASPSRNPVGFTLPYAKHLLASQLGITSETLSRVFARLRELRVLSIKGKEMEIHDRVKLRALGEGVSD